MYPCFHVLALGRVHVEAVYDAAAAAQGGLLSRFRFRPHWRVTSATLDVDGGTQNVPLQWKDRARSVKQLRDADT